LQLGAPPILVLANDEAYRCMAVVPYRMKKTQRSWNSTMPPREKPVRSKRARRKREETLRVYGPTERLDWLHSLPCCVSGVRGDIHCVHVKTGGVSRKADYQWTVPMAAELHRQLHRIGIRSFEARYNIDLELAAIATEQAWLAHCARL